ncbi:MAG: tautomerase family protein [Solirubrobacterales bacterium]|nr:tautomerase family protein [Solirubrobacterales bacterium]
MPLLEVTLPEGSLAPEAVDRLADGLTGALLKWEGAPDTEFFRSIAWLDVHWIPAANAYQGGRPAARPRFRVEVTVPEGALDTERKAGLVEEATRLVLEAAGEDPADPEALMRVWVICHEVKDGGWGGAGRVWTLRDLAAIARQTREQEAAATTA